MVKKMLLSVLFLFILTPIFSSYSFAQTRSWHIVEVHEGTYDGFWMQSTLPTITSRWTPGTENKINYEFWQSTNGKSKTDWVEMGYHDGYDYDIYGEGKYDTSYKGLFVAKKTLTSWTLRKVTSENWKPGENHTWGTDFWPNSDGTTSVDMRSDGAVIQTYHKTTPAAKISVGVEFGQGPILPSSTPQRISSNSYIYNLHVRKYRPNDIWYKWSDVGGILIWNDNQGLNTGISSYYINNLNQILFQ
ncbi:hypothetical protein [Paenibacillus lutrae]|uniref:Uncharacterized protein n=1 Tax=Paenibacillus lutrae TaxID=2078573 RepID=A0A7X3JZ21_9BACL|nr:hypothetical protein [Paenibacillus lutrae]MVO99723.1 hypothetical protein [Paenibacillus lutrae]